jgi:membrane protein DedA with SNARE-associated domain
VPAWLESWPFAWIYLFFVAGAAMRSQALYWVGRGVAAGSLRSTRPSEPATAEAPEPSEPSQPSEPSEPAQRARHGTLLDGWVRLIDGPQSRRAVRAIERWGMPVVPLSFLTVGFQSAVHGASGLLRLHWLRYTLWSVPGWFAWALVWAGGGTAALAGAATLAATSPWALVGVTVLVAAAVTAATVRRRRRRDRRETQDTQDALHRRDPLDSQGPLDRQDPEDESQTASGGPSAASTAPPYRRSRRA